MKNLQATGEAFSPQKRTSSRAALENLKFLHFVGVIFALRDPDPADQN
jgi:hypothetical protein